AHRRVRLMPPILVAASVATLPVLAVMLRYRAVHERYGLYRDLTDPLGYSVSVRTFFETSDLVWLWHRVLPAGNGDLFPGVTSVLLVVVACLWLVFTRSRSEHYRFRVLRALLATVAVVSVAVAAITLWTGPWRIEVGGLVLRTTDMNRAIVGALT